MKAEEVAQQSWEKQPFSALKDIHKCVQYYDTTTNYLIMNKLVNEGKVVCHRSVNSVLAEN